MLAAKQANPNAPLINFGYFNVDMANRGDADDMWVPMDSGPHPGARRRSTQASAGRGTGGSATGSSTSASCTTRTS